MTPFNPDSPLNMRALSSLEEAGIPAMSTLNNNVQHIKEELHVHVFLPELDACELLKTWLRYSAARNVPPTWENLLLTMCHLHLDDVAQQVEAYLSGETEEHIPIRQTEGNIL